VLIGLVAAGWAASPSGDAGSPVILYVDDADGARRQTRIDTGVTDVRTRRVTDLVEPGAPHFARATVLEPCEGPSTDNATVFRLLAQAEELRLAMRDEAAWSRILQTKAAWECLGEPADAVLGARMHFMLAVAADARGLRETAVEAFAAALHSDPDLRWDDDFAPDARAVFEAVRSEEPARHTITLVPTNASVALRIDGRSVETSRGTLEVTQGVHLVQFVGGASRWVLIDRDDWLIVPQAVDDDLVQDPNDAGTRAEIEAFVAGVALPEPVFVPSRQSTWVLDGGWSEHRASANRRLRAPVTTTGLALLATGVAWMAAESASSRARTSGLDSLTSAEYADRSDAHDAGRTRWRIAAGVSAAGVATSMVGGGMWVASW